MNIIRDGQHPARITQPLQMVAVHGHRYPVNSEHNTHPVRLCTNQY